MSQHFLIIYQKLVSCSLPHSPPRLWLSIWIRPMSSTIIDFDMRIAELEQLARHDADPETQTQLLNLRRKRNALTPFGSLPNETIGNILAELILDSSSSPTSFFDLEDMCISHGWTAAMLVCSRFRLVALATSELWSYIDCSANPKWIELCRQRSGNFSLTLMNVAKSGKHLTETVSQASHLMRWAHQVSVHHDGYLEPTRPGLLNILKKSFPDIKLLLLDIRLFSVMGPSNFLHGAWDNLTQLSMVHLTVGQTPTFPSLTHLSLDQAQPLGLDYEHVLNMLRNAPRLEVLVMTRTSRDGVACKGNLSVEVSLPHLRILKLDETVRITLMVLRALPDPSEMLSVFIGPTQGSCHGSDFALTPPPVNSGHVQHLAPIRRTSSIFQHHSDPIPATPIAEITASPSSRIRLPLLPSHPLVSLTVPLSRSHLHIPFTTHLHFAIC
jgi:hypothetical protein